MGYADRSLSTGERITYRTRQHPAVLVLGARWTIIAVVIGMVLFLIGGSLDPEGLSGSFRQAIGWLTALLFFGGLAVFAWTGLRYVGREYVLTNRRVIEVEGVLTRSATDSALEKINDAGLSQSVLGRMFDYGDVTVLTASESGIMRMRMIRSPIDFKKAMLDAKHEHEVDQERAGRPTSPPIREGASASAWTGWTGPAPVDAVTPTAAPVVKAHPDEVARRLAGLADLRDRGAISPEEYDAKKVQLLARL
jgi:uncharacterized membrane protein YdbT with pleckstrin-like domain